MTSRSRQVTSVLVLVVAAAAFSPAQAPPAGPALQLYERLASVGLDPQQVYRANNVDIDREDVHISLDGGTIAFTKAVDGRITGAFFEGDGEVLLLPPNEVERGSMALFTGAAILDERFRTLYLRFNDDTSKKLIPALRPDPEDAATFVEKWDPVARTLAQGDALRLLASFTCANPVPADDRFAGSASRALHGSFVGLHLGNFDVNFDANFPEQVFAGQASTVNGITYYDLWAAFPMLSARRTKVGFEGYRMARIPQYRIRAHIVPPHQFEAEADLTLEAVSGGERTFLLELSRALIVSSVTADGKPVEFIQNPALEGTALARRGDDIVAVVLPAPLAPGDKVQLHFSYAGPVLTELPGGLMYVGARGAWYPNFGLGMADFDLDFRYPEDWTLLATGKRVSLTHLGGEQDAHWVSERPIPVAGFNVGRYIAASAPAGNVRVAAFAAPTNTDISPPTEITGSKWAPPKGPRQPKTPPPILMAASPGAEAESVAQRAAEAIDFLSPRLGAFPYASLALTEMPGEASQGWPGMIFLSRFVFLDTEQRKTFSLSDYGRLLYGRLMIRHEVAHQWWGDELTWKSYRDQWIVEALANYSALLSLESSDPAGFQLAMARYRSDLLRKNKKDEPYASAGPVTLGIRLNSSHFPDGYDVVSYGRGTWLIHMLRALLRDGHAAPGADPDARFLQILHGLVDRYRGGSMSTADLQHAFEAALPAGSYYEGKPTLDWFFKGWVNGTALPRLQVSGVRFEFRHGKREVSGTILQKDAPDSLVTCVPVYGRTGKTLVFLGRVFTDGSETTFHVPAPAGVRSVVLDPEQTILTRP